MFTETEFSSSSRLRSLRSSGVPQAGKQLAADEIASRIQSVRGAKVLLDSDLAELYGVTTKRLNEQVRRNPVRFPPDFVFQLTDQEFGRLRSQFATSNIAVGRGGRRYLPHAFTEHGSLMAANVLSSPRAVEVSVYIVRAFVSLRQTLAAHRDLASKLEALEKSTEALAMSTMRWRRKRMRNSRRSSKPCED